MKNSTIYILGHKNPDSDSICAAIGYGELKRKLGYQKIIVGRLGELNNETKFILNHFGVEAPELIENVRAQVSDMDFYEPTIVSPDVPIGDAWNIMVESKRHMLAVVDGETNEFIGVLSIGDIAKVNMETKDCNLISKYHSSIENIVNTLKATLLSGDYQKNMRNLINGRVIVAMEPHEISKENPKEQDIILVRANKLCISTALESEAKYIFIIGECGECEDGCKIDFTKIDKNKLVFRTGYDLCSTIILVNHSIPVSAIMKTKDLVTFNQNDYFTEVRNTMIDSRYRNFPVLDDNNRIAGIISRRHIIDIDRKKVILVDHNEKSQAVDGLDEAEILEIVDHHRLADIQTGNPVYFRNEPVGCTSTIISNMYFEHNLTPDSKTAGVLLGAIISDTLLFKSPTCTIIDKMVAEKLASIAGVDLESFGMEMLKAGANITGRPMKEVLHTDFKEFNISNRKIFVAQVYTTDLRQTFEIESEMLSLMETECNDKGYELGVLMVTDILGSGTQLLFTGMSKDIAEKAFNAEKGSNTVFLPKVVSRKKEIIPPLTKYA